MHLTGGLLLLLCLHLLLFPHEALPATAPGHGCQRRCGGLVVPYPFGFSGNCPIKLACNESDATPALIFPGNSVNATMDHPYTVVKFNATNSTFVVSLVPSCNRTVSGAKRWLSGANYGVSSRTGMFLRGGCHNATNATACSVPAEVMSKMLRTAQCPGGDETASSLTCIASIPPNSTVEGVGLFARWEKVEEPRCDNLLTSAFYGDTPEGVFSLELAVAELVWWVNGNCNHSAGGGGDQQAGSCAANATCHDVQTPSGEWGHQCKCLEGFTGDGFAAGDGCYLSGESSLSFREAIGGYAPRVP